MFGELIAIDGNNIRVKNLSGKINLQCLNYHVIVPEKDKNYVIMNKKYIDKGHDSFRILLESSWLVRMNSE